MKKKEEPESSGSPCNSDIEEVSNRAGPMVFKLTPDCQSRIASGRLPGLLEVTLQQAFQTAAVTGLVAGHFQWNGGYA